MVKAHFKRRATENMRLFPQRALLPTHYVTLRLLTTSNKWNKIKKWTCFLTLYLPGLALLSPGHGCSSRWLAGRTERQRSGLVLLFSASSLYCCVAALRSATGEIRIPACTLISSATTAIEGLPVAESACHCPPSPLPERHFTSPFSPFSAYVIPSQAALPTASVRRRAQ